MRKASFAQTIKNYRPYPKSQVDETGLNLVNRDFSVKTLNTFWVTDITYTNIPDKGCHYDNAVIESFHASLKKELVL